MSVTYSFLDKNKKQLNIYRGEACFYNANYYYKNDNPKAEYFCYKAESTLSKEQVRSYIEFLNSTRHFYKIDVEEFMEDYKYIYKIGTQNPLRTFAILTAIRYIQEETKAVEFILKNQHVKTISKIKLLLLSCIYANNSGHFLNMKPLHVIDFIKNRLKKKETSPSNNITNLGLHKYYSDLATTWRLEPNQTEALTTHYKVKPL